MGTGDITLYVVENPNLSEYSICIQEAISQVATINTVTEHVVISSYVVALCECTLVTSWLFCQQNVSIVLSIALHAGQYTFQVIKKF